MQSLFAKSMCGLTDYLNKVSASFTEMSESIGKTFRNFSDGLKSIPVIDGAVDDKTLDDYYKQLDALIASLPIERNLGELQQSTSLAYQKLSEMLDKLFEKSTNALIDMDQLHNGISNISVAMSQLLKDQEEAADANKDGKLSEESKKILAADVAALKGFTGELKKNCFRIMTEQAKQVDGISKEMMTKLNRLTQSVGRVTDAALVATIAEK